MYQRSCSNCIDISSQKSEYIDVQGDKQTLMEGTSMKATVGMKVTGYSGSYIGVIIDSHYYIGTIIKVNKKSIKVNITEVINTHGEKEVSRYNTNHTVTYTLWKITEKGEEIYRSEACLYGFITIK